MSIIQGNAHTSTGGYQIERSLRFNSPDSAYFNRTPAVASNRRTFTWSGWVKRGALANGYLFTAGTTSTNRFQIDFYNNTMEISMNNGSWVIDMTSTALLRDPSAWYHIVVAVDTTQATSTNRVKVYVNGVQITSFNTSTYPSQNLDTPVNSVVEHDIGISLAAGSYFDGYMTEINFVDGQALTPSDFGETDAATGVWKPKKFSGTYGTNGFYLKFADNSGTTATTLGKDSSGNGNNWTPNNFSVTAGAGNDSLVDTPTSYGTDTGAGGEVRGNYATLNPLSLATYIVSYNLSNGNLQLNTNAGTTYNCPAFSTISMPTGKWYAEFVETTQGSTADRVFIGVSRANAVGDPNPNNVQNYSVYYLGINGSITKDNSSVTTAATYTLNDVIGVAFDADALTCSYYKNGVFQYTVTGLTAGVYQFLAYGYYANSITANFGQRPFAYTAPSGFKALCTQNLPTPAIGATSTTQANDYFNIVTYTGNGTGSRSITGVGFQPDFVWIKNRASGSVGHRLYDAIRGTTKELYSHSNISEYTETQGLTTFDSDGFTVGTSAGVNESSSGIVAWNWKANGTGVTNTAGTITSTVSANTTSGFSIVTYTGTGATGGTVGHGLGVKPGFIIVKKRSATGGWVCWHQSLTGGNEQDRYIYLNLTDAAGTTTNYWGSGITSSTFGVWTTGGDNNTLGSTIVAYCFAAIAGYSAFGSYTGNGSADGPFVYCGFRPRFILIKDYYNPAGNNNWVIFDTSRDTYNVCGDILRPNLSNAELVSPPRIDILSNGFKIRVGGALPNDASGTLYIYAAFAESPFKYSLAR